jgi:hypothetical protein
MPHRSAHVLQLPGFGPPHPHPHTHPPTHPPTHPLHQLPPLCQQGSPAPKRTMPRPPVLSNHTATRHKQATLICRGAGRRTASLYPSYCALHI